MIRTQTQSDYLKKRYLSLNPGNPPRDKKPKDKAPEMQRSGAYTLAITKKGITIGIVDDNSLFYAAQNLLATIATNKTRVKSPASPLLTIKDHIRDVLYSAPCGKDSDADSLGATPTVSSKSAFTEGSS